MTVLFGKSDTIGRALSRLAEKVLLKAEICTLYGKPYNVMYYSLPLILAHLKKSCRN